MQNRIEAFVADYNHRRIANLTPADVYCQTILL
jgi:hypothetical protein